MNTQALIDAALQAQDDFDAAKSAQAAATLRLQQAQATLDTANAALSADLSANGPAYTLDETADPAVLTVYQAVDISEDPRGWTATVIRPAEAA